MQYFIPARGNGKSLACLAYAKKLAESGEQIVFVRKGDYMKLVGDINVGYRYVSNEEAERIAKEVKEKNMMKINFKRVEKFCTENDIRWEVDHNCMTQGVKMKFTSNKNNKREYFEFDANKLCDPRCDAEARIMYVLRRSFIAEPRCNKTLEIKNVIFSGPCTIVMWTDGDKTVVKCENEDFDREKGLAMAVAKKFLGTNKTKSNYNDIFKKWIPEEEINDSIPLTHTPGTTPKETKLSTYAKMKNQDPSYLRKQARLGNLPGAHKIDGHWYIQTGEMI